MKAAALAISAFSLCLSGCTALGFFVGSSVDSRNATIDTLSVPSYTELAKGVPTLVLTQDSAVVKGLYQGIESAPPRTDQKQFKEWRAEKERLSRVVKLGDSITVLLNTGPLRSWTGEFAGFTENSIRVKRDVGLPYNVVVATANLKAVDSVYDHHGNSFGPRLFDSTFVSGDMAAQTHLVLTQETDTIRLPSHMILHVDQVALKKSANGRVAGAMIGMLVDGVLVAVAIKNYRPIGSGMWK